MNNRAITSVSVHKTGYEFGPNSYFTKLSKSAKLIIIMML